MTLQKGELSLVPLLLLGTPKSDIREEKRFLPPNPDPPISPLGLEGTEGETNGWAKDIFQAFGPYFCLFTVCHDIKVT